MAAGIARLQADVREFLGNKDRKRLFPGLTAVCAVNPPKVPLVRTERTQQEPLSAVSFRPQHSKHGSRPAQRTKIHGQLEWHPRRTPSAKLRVGLQERPREKLRERPVRWIVNSSVLPVLLEPFQPRMRRQRRHFACRFAQRGGSLLFNQGEKCPVVRQQDARFDCPAGASFKSAWRFLVREGRNVRMQRLLKQRDLPV